VRRIAYSVRVVAFTFVSKLLKDLQYKFHSNQSVKIVLFNNLGNIIFTQVYGT